MKEELNEKIGLVCPSCGSEDVYYNSHLWCHVNNYEFGKELDDHYGKWLCNDCESDNEPISYLEYLKQRQIYLNNHVRDDNFIGMVYDLGLEEYFMYFPSDTSDIDMLEEYINTVESMFYDNGVDF